MMIIIKRLIMCNGHLYYELSSMLLFVLVGLGAGATSAIVVFLMVFITVVALLFYKKYYKRDTSVVQISKQADVKVERPKPNNMSSSTKVTSSQLIVGDQTAKRKRKKKLESTNRTSPSLALQPIP